MSQKITSSSYIIESNGDIWNVFCTPMYSSPQTIIWDLWCPENPLLTCRKQLRNEANYLQDVQDLLLQIINQNNLKIDSCTLREI